jgi:hypothetical protein
MKDNPKTAKRKSSPKSRRPGPSTSSVRAAKAALTPLRVLECAAAYGRGAWYKRLCSDILQGPRPRHPETGKIMNAGDTLAWAREHFFGDEEAGIRAARALAALENLGHVNMQDFLRAERLDDLPRELLAAVGEIECENIVVGEGEDARVERRVKKFKLINKVEPLKLVLQSAGKLVERKVLTGEGGGPIETADVSALSPVERQQRLAAILAAKGQ